METESAIIKLIFDSNHIESAGSNLDNTIKSCTKVSRDDLYDLTRICPGLYPTARESF